MSASCVKLQATLMICEEFGILCYLKFNVIKSYAGLGQKVVCNSSWVIYANKI